MAIDKNKLASIIENARVLCNPQGDRIINSYKRNDILNDPDPASYNDDWDSLYMSKPRNNVNEDNLSYNDSDVERSNLPQHIKESLMKEKIPVSSNISVTDGINIKSSKRNINEHKSISTMNNTTPINMGNNIDYSIIKAIFNECLREYFDNKQPLNESASLQTIGLQNGNISLVDNKGNIYKAKLEKIGNKNDKK